jgi:hypothetical protein
MDTALDTISLRNCVARARFSLASIFITLSLLAGLIYSSSLDSSSSLFESHSEVISKTFLLPLCND